MESRYTKDWKKIVGKTLSILDESGRREVGILIEIKRGHVLVGSDWYRLKKIVKAEILD